jgi:hypothetical protein
MPDVTEFRQLYETADSFAREVGESRSEVQIPAHNELRYAGHHLLQSLSDEGTVVNEDLHRKAMNHCARAMYEAAEAGIMHELEVIQEFRQAYKTIVMGDVVPDYHKRIVKAKSAQKLLIKGRANRVDVEEHVSQYMEVFRELGETRHLLDAARDDLNAKKDAQDSSRRRAVVTSLLVVLGILVTVWRIIIVSS